MSQNSIVILCGGPNSGKTTTVRRFYGIGDYDPHPPFIEKIINGRSVCAVGLGSSQEPLEFCNVDKVNSNIRERIAKCESNASKKPYVLIIPFTMKSQYNPPVKVNEHCIIKPIEELQKRFKVFLVYLRKKNGHYLAEKDALMAGRAIETWETTKTNYDKSRELETFIKSRVIP